MNKLLAKVFGSSAKLTTGVVGQALTFALAYYGKTNKWVTLAVAAASALGVYAVPNQAMPPAPAAAPAPEQVHDQ